jgi:hypothetical protein
MIKKFNQFVNESRDVRPGPTEEGSAKVNISSSDSHMFSTEPALQKLITDNKISLLTPDLWYTIGDSNTIGILQEYFPSAEFNMGDDEEGLQKDDEFEYGEDEENESKVNEATGRYAVSPGETRRRKEKQNSDLVKLTNLKKDKMTELTKTGVEKRKIEKKYDDLIREIHDIEDDIDNAKKKIK